MSCNLIVQNRRRGQRLNLGLLKKITTALLEDHLQRKDYELGVSVVGQAEMTRLNETFLRHAGSTDVITFDYAEPHLPSGLVGDIVVCADEAHGQARRFGSTWQVELVRYVVHGVLHLSGHDDQHTEDRRRMKREENRLLGQLAKRFSLTRLSPSDRSKSSQIARIFYRNDRRRP